MDADIAAPPASLLNTAATEIQRNHQRELTERLEAAGRVDADLVTLLAHQTNHLRLMDRRVGGIIIAQQMAGHLDSMAALLSHAILGSQRTAIAAELSDAHALAGWLGLDLGELVEAWQHYELSEAAAREANSETLLAHAMAEQSFILTDAGQTRSATALVDHARNTARHKVPKLLEAWLSAAEGEVRAVAGDKDASRRAFDHARQLMPDGPPDPALLYLMFDRVHLSRWHGNALARLGDVNAIDHLYAAIDGSVYSIRARASLHTDLAYAHAAAGHRDQVAIQLRQASAFATRAGSRRQRKRIHALMTQRQQV